MRLKYQVTPLDKSVNLCYSRSNYIEVSVAPLDKSVNLCYTTQNYIEVNRLVSTVTTSTITTVTTIAAMGLTATISIVAVVALIGFLTTKELASASLSPSSHLIARFFNVGILPMVMAFVVIVAVEIARILA